MFIFPGSGDIPDHHFGKGDIPPLLVVHFELVYARVQVEVMFGAHVYLRHVEEVECTFAHRGAKHVSILVLHDPVAGALLIPARECLAVGIIVGVDARKWLGLVVGAGLHQHHRVCLVGDTPRLGDEHGDEDGGPQGLGHVAERLVPDELDGVDKGAARNQTQNALHVIAEEEIDPGVADEPDVWL